jgi:Tfp pilus assembly protein PilV
MIPPELRRDREAGFSLIEVTLSIVILVLGLMSLGVAMTMAYRQGRISDERKIAREWAVSQLEAIRSMHFSNLTDDPVTGGYLTPTTWTNYRWLGEQADTESPTDSEPDIWVRYFYSTTTSQTINSVAMDLHDPLLTGLNPPITTDWKFSSAQTTRGVPCGQVLFEDTTTNGLTEGNGYWVTVRVSWNGAGGDQVMDFHTMVTKR